MRKQITLLILFFLASSMLALAQELPVTGTVKDDKGPVPGVTVKVKGTGKGVATDFKGHYVINAPSNAILVFSIVGYASQEQPINGRNQINVTLAEDNKQLNEVVVVGYGTRQKKDVTGSVSSVKATQLENENPTSIGDILKGNVAGLSVSMNTSAKGGGDLLVRGKTTLTANTSPLIVLDGVIYNGQLADINPNDIESVDVLKDASALAVYGSKAATGVVAVTTKKGKNGPPVITLNTNFGLAELSKNQKVYSPQGFLDWRADVLRSTNTTNPYYQYTDPRKLPAGVTVDQWMALTGATGDPVDQWLSRLGLVPNERANYVADKTIDWADLVFRKGFRQDHTVSMSGKKDEVNYYMSLNYTKNQNLIQGGQFSNVRARMNLEGQAGKFLTLGMNAQYAVRNEGAIEADWTQITNNSPYGDFYDPKTGELARIPTDDAGLNARNPFLNNHYDESMNIQNTLFANLYGKLKLPFGITFQTNFTPGFDSYRNFYHTSSKNPNNTIVGGTASRAMENRYSYQIDNLLKWNHTFGEIHNIDVTLLANKEKYQSWYTYEYNEGFSPNDDLSFHNIGAGNKPSVSSDDRVYTGDALMGRVNYTLLNRYLLTASVRRDGYSAFGQRFPRATFPSVALGWIFTDESFMKKAEWLNYAKLRVSYGVNGNRDLRDGNGTVDPYRALSVITTGKYPLVSPTGVATANSAIYVSQMQNDQLKWEQTASLNLGLDFTVINNRLSGSIDVYNKKTTNLLVQRAIPDVTGFKSVIANIGELNNKGMELNLSSKNITKGNIIWNTTLNFFFNRNTIKHLYGKAAVTDANGNTTMVENSDLGNGWFIGKDIDVVWDYKVLGVWQTDEKDEAKKYGAVPGDFKLEKLVNSGPNQYKYTNDDKQYLGYRSPRFTWSLRNDFNIYKNFDFSFLLLSNWGQLKQYNQALNSPGSVGFGRSTSYVQPYWTPTNPINDYARLNSGFSGTTVNVYRKASFIRLNTISLGYNFPKQWVNRLKMQSMKLYANVNNAAVYSPDWNFWDPENNGPTPRYMSVGLNVVF
ncbi:SusC/RagA family TonB-linked outer membrane protein [Mucilaginibacter sp. SG564]|uniref:SusC/RagA family TonB-linked outer membrane protein n=1 Tax=unclassified Mucilaginibacter TaxID=2617802 RepID=UPI0015516BD6|nr:SusC/RagA family TonB-linked outer membrane protein [Mucilaginibacter sp. SG564]NOW96594.1 TonB-linked SusC/RagA family outer membrane protein [Mucilaginibacter sp. SG564]